MKITIGEKDFLNQKEACLYMRVSRETLKEWEIDGLRVWRPSKRTVLYHKKWLLEYAERRTK